MAKQYFVFRAPYASNKNTIMRNSSRNKLLYVHFCLSNHNLVCFENSEIFLRRDQTIHDISLLPTSRYFRQLLSIGVLRELFLIKASHLFIKSQSGLLSVPCNVFRFQAINQVLPALH